MEYERFPSNPKALTNHEMHDSIIYTSCNNFIPFKMNRWFIYFRWSKVQGEISLPNSSGQVNSRYEFQHKSF